MTGFAFPKMLTRNSVNLIEGPEDVIKDLKLFFNSEVFEFRFDPGYGSNLENIRLRPKCQLTLDLLVDAVMEAQMYFPNVRFNRKSVTITYQKAGDISIEIKCLLDNNNYITELVVLQGGNQSNG